VFRVATQSTRPKCVNLLVGKNPGKPRRRSTCTREVEYILLLCFKPILGIVTVGGFFASQGGRVLLCFINPILGNRCGVSSCQQTSDNHLGCVLFCFMWPDPHPPPTANPTWGDIFESSKLKARTSLLPRLKERDVRALSFEL